MSTMKKIVSWVLVVIAASACVAAEGNSQQPLRADATPPSPELVVMKRNLSGLIDTGKLADLRWRNFSDYRGQIRDFYQNSDYGLAWVVGNQPTTQAKAMIQVLQNADKKGLRPDDYDAAR